MTEEITKVEDLSELMTPEEMAMFKKLQAKRKAMQKASGSLKEQLFKSLTENYAPTIVKAKKDVVTISLDKPFSDGNTYAISFGVEEDEDNTEEVDSSALALKLIEENIGNIEPLMGISNSLKLSGQYEGKKLFWQIRKRAGKDSAE